jgi:aldehyde dehydrogenase (NAD+)
MKTFQNFIAGEWRDADGGGTFDDVNPADTRDVIGRFPKSSAADVGRAVAAAQRRLAAMCCAGSATSWSSGRSRSPIS